MNSSFIRYIKINIKSIFSGILNHLINDLVSLKHCIIIFFYQLYIIVFHSSFKRWQLDWNILTLHRHILKVKFIWFRYSRYFLSNNILEFLIIVDRLLLLCSYKLNQIVKFLAHLLVRLNGFFLNIFISTSFFNFCWRESCISSFTERTMEFNF